MRHPVRFPASSPVFVPGDEIDIAATTLTGRCSPPMAAWRTLVLTDNGVVVISLALAGISATDVFQLLPDGIDGTLIRVAMSWGLRHPATRPAHAF